MWHICTCHLWQMWHNWESGWISVVNNSTKYLYRAVFLYVNTGTEKGQFLFVSKFDLWESKPSFFVLEKTELY